MAVGPVHRPWTPARPDDAGLRDVLVTPPAVEPVTLDEARAWAVVQDPDDDPIVADLIVACRRQVENDLGQALITQTRAAYYHGFPRGRFRLPRVPIQAIASIQYADTGGALLTASASLYGYTAGAMSGDIRLAFGSIWPISMDWDDSVQVRYTCGYGDTADAVPMEIRLAIRALVAANYAMRESHMFMQGGVVASTPLYDSLLNSARHGAYG